MKGESNGAGGNGQYRMRRGLGCWNRRFSKGNISLMNRSWGTITELVKRRIDAPYMRARVIAQLTQSSNPGGLFI